MDKYEFNIKLEQIKKLAAKKEYQQAAAIAKEMNWNKVKDWSTLATIINVQEAAGDYEEARDMAILAYNRNLGGRKLIYKLTEFFIKVEDFENAEELYNEYARMSAHDVNRYILYYDLRRAQGAPASELVEILEEYKESEIDEKYMYELANLYYKTGRREDCIKTCDNLVLWFQDGIYVEMAVKLKEKIGVNLSNTQKRILVEMNARKSDEEANKERMFMEQKELARLKKDEVGDILAEDDKEQETASDYNKVNATQQETPADNKDREPESDISIELVQNNQNSALKESIVKAIERQQEANQVIKQEANQQEEKQEAKQETKKEAPDFSETVNQASLSLKELIENAKKKIENSCEKISREDDEEARKAAQKRIDEKAEAMDIEVKVPNYSVYDTHNLQEELAENVKNLFVNEQEETFRPPFERKESGGDKEEKEAVIQQTVTEKTAYAEESGEVADTADADDEQIEGQLSIADWMEAVREEKYGKQDTREFSKAELERMLDERNEKSAAYERIIAQKKEEALRQGMEFNEAEAKRAAEAEVSLESVKRDLAMRTGKAAFILEQNTAKELKKAELESKEVQQSAMQAEAGKATAKVQPEVTTEVQPEAAAKVQPEATIEAQPEAAAKVQPEATTEAQPEAAAEMQPEVSAKIPTEALVTDGAETGNIEQEEISLNTAHFTPVTDEVLKTYEKSEELKEEVQPDKAVVDAVLSRQELAASEVVHEDRPAAQRESEQTQTEKKLSGELAKIFRKYREMPGLEAQLVELFESLDAEMDMSTSVRGNILISGNSSSDKTDLARTIIRAINYIYPDRPKKIAKTSGESINQRGIAKAMGKLKGTALIVEGAGTIQPKRINEILSCMNEDTDRMIVIFEDSDAEMNVLLNFNPEMGKVFNHKITLKQYNVNELVEMAKRFARKRQYEVDDDALLELYLKIDKLHNMNDNIKLDDIKEVINKAIANSEKRASRRFFGGLKKKRSDNGDVIFLTEADFKD